MGFSRQGLEQAACLPPGDLLDSEVESKSLVSPALTGLFFTASTTWEAQKGHRPASNGRSSKKNSKEGRFWGTQLPEVNFNLTHTFSFFFLIIFFKKHIF